MTGEVQGEECDDGKESWIYMHPELSRGLSRYTGRASSSLAVE